jgi:glycosyltransferase involved in cell wall biosynthesis
MKPIRILRIASVKNDRRGGMSRTMYLTGDCLAEEGFEVSYAFAEHFRWPFNGGWSRFSQPVESGVRAFELEGNGPPWDIVEVHESLALGCGLMRAIAGRPWKVVAFSYGIERLGFEAMLEYRMTHGVPVKAKSRIVGAVQCAVSALGLHFCDHVVCSNQKDVEVLSSAGFPRSMLTRHFSGIDDAMLEAGKKGCSHGSGGILFLGSWIDRKGIWDLVPAVTGILREKPGAFLTVAGCQMEEAFVLGQFPEDVQSRVRVIRRLNSAEELESAYRAHSVFLLPSYFEGQPLVMMEAAAFGLAIVTTPVCGMLDFIEHGSNGLFVQVGQPSSIQAAISRLLDNPQEAQSLGAAARLKVESHTWRASALNLAGVYKRLVGR